MKGVYTSINNIRRSVFTEVAKLAYEYEEGKLSEMEHIPYKIIPGEISTYRDSVFLERAIVAERMRLAMGLPLRSAAEQAPISQGAEEATKPESYYQPPLINVIKFACHSCPDNVVKVTDSCQGCLAHPCVEVCPKKAVSIRNGRSFIDQDACIKCGKCVDACPYHAILRQQRPCASACGMNAIGSDAYGRAEIDENKCVSCGMCLVNCPFGAISDKSQIFQCIQAIRSETPVYAAIAPSVTGQFGPKVTFDKLRSAFRRLGFKDVAEVAAGADLCTVDEAERFVKEVPGDQPFMATSCCPAWIEMIRKTYPKYEGCISMSLTPMVLTGRLIKKIHPECKVAFIGPCSAKKLEAMRTDIRSDIDFVLTFEEVMGMFEAKEVDFSTLKSGYTGTEASGDGRGFAVSGGVADAVVQCIRETDPDREVKVEKAEGLANCRKLMAKAAAGAYNGFLLEGMACPGGCVGGVGTLQTVLKSTNAIGKQKKESATAHSFQSEYKSLLPELD